MVSGEGTMSWEDLVFHILTTTSKVEKVIVYNLQGHPVAASEGVETNQSEGFAIVTCLYDPGKSMTKIQVDNDMFLCVQGSKFTLAGTTVKDHKRVLVARQDDGHVVVVFGKSTEQSSFTSELKECLVLRAQGQLVGKQQLEQQRRLLGSDGGADSQSLADDQQVLVSLA
ncbi:uncharacterized protein LOC131932649 isoform X2 [Physella acuta]|uniref:uncharacterized protein LOC131932649 isoform X2 n=1 Tax=Physella acuta TaxID=109671 RepID=UPI0027DE1CDC|nr:uncharacterized protein LOC131932649 isoform X2 [Physella acuta]